MDLDIQLLRQYTKVAKWWEDKGHSVYSLSSMAGIPGYVMGIFGIGGILLSSIKPLNLDPFVAGMSFGAVAMMYGQDVVHNLYGLLGLSKEEYTSDTIARDRRDVIAKRLNRIVRLPTFGAGLGFIAKGGYDIFRWIALNEPLDPNTHLYFSTGLGLLGLSSSMYLKDRDPKLLEKQPSENSIGEMLSKIRSFIPARTPTPKPVFQTTSKEMILGLYPV